METNYRNSFVTHCLCGFLFFSVFAPLYDQASYGMQQEVSAAESEPMTIKYGYKMENDTILMPANEPGVYDDTPTPKPSPAPSPEKYEDDPPVPAPKGKVKADDDNLIKSPNPAIQPGVYEK